LRSGLHFSARTFRSATVSIRTVEAAATGLAGATGAVKAIAELERDSMALDDRERRD